jgi:hypothetical protein
MAMRYDDAALDQMALVKRMGSRPRAGNIDEQPGAMRPNIEPAPSSAPPAAAAPATSQQPTDPLAGIDTSKWDTDGYAAPKRIGSRGGSAPIGFEQANWGNQNVQTPKYAVGGLAHDLAQKVGGYNAEFEKQFGDILKEAYGDEFRYMGADKVVGRDGHPVDFIVNWGTPEARLDWQTSNPNDPAPVGAGVGAGMVPGGIGAGVNMSQLTDGGFFQQLMEQMRGKLGAPSTDQNALLSLLKR